MKKTIRGFTIVELLIVIVVIAILAAITIVAYGRIQVSAKTASSKNAAVQVQKKIEVYAANAGKYPSNNLTTDLNSLPESSLPAAITIAGPHPTVIPTAATGTSAIKVDICTNPLNSGYKVYYWDYSAADQTGQQGAMTLAYGGAIGSTGSGCNGWTSAQ